MRSQTVSAEVKYDGQSLQEAKISRLIYTLWCTAATENGDMALSAPWQQAEKRNSDRSSNSCHLHLLYMYADKFQQYFLNCLQ